MVEELTPAKFQAKVNRKFSVIEFVADWCPSCKELSTVFDKVAKKFAKVSFGRINIENRQNIASEQVIVSVPTIIIYKEGKEIERFVGKVPEEVLENEIRSRLQ